MGNTALHYAVMANRSDLAQVLLSKGASETLKNQRQMTALQCGLELVSQEYSECMKHVHGFNEPA